MPRIQLSLVAMLRGALVLGVLLVQARPAWAHDPTIDTVLQLVVDRGQAKGELWVPIEGMQIYDSVLDGTFTVDGKAEPMPIATSHAEMLLESLLIKYDQTELKPKLTSTTVRMLNAGISMEEIDPRPMAVYMIDFTAAEAVDAPEEIVFSQRMLVPPDEVTLDQTVLCMIKLRQPNELKWRTELIAAGERVTFKMEWPAEVVQAPEPAPDTPAAPAAPAAPTTAPAVASAASAESAAAGGNAPIYALSAGGFVAAGLAIFLGKRLLR